MRPQHKQKRDLGILRFFRTWGFTLMGVILLGGSISWGVAQLLDPSVLTVRVVNVTGELRYLDRNQLQNVVYQAIDGSFFSLDLRKIRRELAQMPWINSVRIRRNWPDRLTVEVVEHRPFAFWNDDGLLSDQGQIFHPESLPKLPEMVKVRAEDRDAPMVFGTLQRITQQLAEVGLSLDELRLDPRHAWLLRMRDGLELSLGRRDPLDRLDRFVQIYPAFQVGAGARMKQMDLRYGNGFAVVWDESEKQQVNKENTVGNMMRVATRVAE